MKQFVKNGTDARLHSTRLFALALLLSGCVVGGAGAQAAEPLPGDTPLEVTSGTTTIDNKKTGVSDVTVSGGTLELRVNETDSTYGQLIFSGDVTLSGDGTINLHSGYPGMQALDDVEGHQSATGVFTQTDNSIFNVGGAKYERNHLIVREFNANGGKTNIEANGKGDLHTNVNWLDRSSSIMAYEIEINEGADIYIGPYGTIKISDAYNDTTHGDQTEGMRYEIKGGTITLAGKKVTGDEGGSAVLYAGSKATRGRLNGKTGPSGSGANKTYVNYVPLKMSGGKIIVADGDEGGIVSRETFFSGDSEFNVEGKLIVTGAAAMTSDGKQPIESFETGISTVTSQWGDFNFTNTAGTAKGGTITVGQQGVVDFVSGYVTLHGGNGGTIAGSGEHLTTLHIVDPGTTMLNDTRGSGVYARALEVSNGTFTVDNLDVDVADATTQHELTYYWKNTDGTSHKIDLDSDEAKELLQHNTAYATGKEYQAGVRVVEGGTLTVLNDATYQNTVKGESAALTISGGGKHTVAGKATFEGGGGGRRGTAVEVTGEGSLMTVGSAESKGGSVTVKEGATFEVEGDATFDDGVGNVGTLTLDNGTMIIGSDAAFNGGDVKIANGSTLNVGGKTTLGVSRASSLANTTIITGEGSKMTVGSVVSVGGKVTVSEKATFLVDEDASFDQGTLALDNGTMTIGTTAEFIHSSVSITNGSTLDVGDKAIFKSTFRSNTVIVTGDGSKMTVGSVASTGETQVTISDKALFAVTGDASFNAGSAVSVLGNGSLTIGGDATFNGGTVTVSGPGGDYDEDQTPSTLQIDGHSIFADGAKTGNLAIKDGGTLIAQNLNLDGAPENSDFFTFTTDGNHLNFEGGVNEKAKDVLSVTGSGHVLLHVADKSNAYSITKEELETLRQQLLGDTDGTLGLFGVYYGEKGEYATDDTGTINANLSDKQFAGADVHIDISGGIGADNNVTFGEDVTVGSINFNNDGIGGPDPERINEIVSNKDFSLTGSVGAGNSLVTGGSIDGKIDLDVDLVAHGDVTLGGVNLGDTVDQGGKINGTIILDPGSPGSENEDATLEVSYGEFGSEGIKSGIAKDITVNVGKEGQSDSSGSLIVGEGGIDLSTATGDVTVNVDSGSTLIVNSEDGIDLSGTDTANVTLANGGSIVVNKGGDINLSNTTGKDSINVADKGSVLTVTEGKITLAGGDYSSVGVTDGGSISANEIAGATNVGTSGEGSSITTTGNVTDVKNIVIDGGEVTVGGTLELGTDGLFDATIAGGGTLEVKELDLSNDTADSTKGIIYVGDSSHDADEGGQGTLMAGTATLGGATIFADPAWKPETNNINDASRIIIGELAKSKLDGNIIVGANSYFVYGKEGIVGSEWMNSYFSETGLTWGEKDVAAAAALTKPLSITDSHALIVGGQFKDQSSLSTIIDTATGALIKDGLHYKGGAFFGGDSLLIVDANGIDSEAALTSLGNGAGGKGGLYLEDGAKLHLVDARVGQTYQITDEFDVTVTSGGSVGTQTWAGRNDGVIIYDVWKDDSDGNVYASTTRREAGNVYHGLSDGAAGMMNWVYANGRNSVNDQGGVGFISRITDSTFNPFGNPATDIEGAAQIAALGGAPLNALNVMRMNHNAIGQRFSFLSAQSPVNAVGVDDCFASCDTAFSGRGLSIWAGPAYEHGRVGGMEIGNFENGFKSNMGGGNVGLDYTFGDNFRVGLMGSMGGGKNKADGGDFAYTENKFDYYGISGFAGWSMCNFSLLLDGGFTHVKNKIDQQSADGNLYAEAKVNSWDVGLTAEYRFETSALDIVPHAGLRYEGINTRDHDVVNRSRYSNGVMNVDSATQHVLMIPFGVGLVKNFNACNWTLSPYADVGGRVSVGNRDYKTDTTLLGAAAAGMPRFGYKTKLMDSVAFEGKAGFNADNGRFFSGVNYNITHGKNQTTHGFWANVGVNF